MILGSFVTDVNEANVYIVGCPKTREAMAIDAGGYDIRFKPFLEKYGLKLTKVFITHDHYDHVDGLAQICTQLADGKPEIHAGSAHRGWQQVKEGETIKIGELTGRVLETPGHTPDALTLVVEDKVAFVGDCLFAGSIGGTSSEKLKQQEIANIKNKIFPLGDQVELYTGHGAPTTVGVERQKNPFLI